MGTLRILSAALLLFLLPCLTPAQETATTTTHTDEPTLPTDKPTLPTDKPTLPTDKPALSTDKPTPPNTPNIADVCNMSLITSIENVDAKQTKCKCDLQNMDVDCQDLDITELPKLISFPKGVHVASFSNNKIANLNSDTFYNGRDIRELDLSFNQIDFVSSKAFLALKNLKRLDLSHNRIWNLPNSAFEGSTNLRRLDLSSNDLFNIFPDLFKPLAELRELILQSNPLQELEPKHFEHLQKLEVLNLESTLLKVVPDHVFVFLPKLKTLSLANNHLSEVPTEALQVLHLLKTLDLSGNAIEKVRSEAFKGMSGLVILYLDRMPTLTSIERYAFGDAINLQELHCSYNYLLYEIDESALVRKLDNRKVRPAQLFLRQNQISTLPKALVEWSGEVELHLRDNPLFCDCRIDWMVSMKLKNDFQAHSVCAGPSDLEGLSLSQLKDHELTCGMQLAEAVMIVCAVVTGFLIVVLIVAFLVWRRNYAGYNKPYFYIPKNRHINDIEYSAGDDDI